MFCCVPHFGQNEFCPAGCPSGVCTHSIAMVSGNGRYRCVCSRHCERSGTSARPLVCTYSRTSARSYAAAGVALWLSALSNHYRRAPAIRLSLFISSDSTYSSCTTTGSASIALPIRSSALSALSVAAARCDSCSASAAAACSAVGFCSALVDGNGTTATRDDRRRAPRTCPARTARGRSTPDTVPEFQSTDVFAASLHRL